MTPARWDKVKKTFQAALSRTPDERVAFLRSACGDDESLRKEVIALLAAHDKDGSFIDSPAYKAGGSVFLNHQELQIGQEVGHYQIVSTLGKGGMGEVYLAEDSKLHRKVAIKLLPADSAASEAANQRLLREAQAAAKLDHPNICTVHEVAEANGRAFIVMSFVEGVSLDRRLKQTRLELSESLKIATQVADAIAEAQAHGVVHRDIKAANVIVTPRNQAKVMDFGLAKFSATLGSAQFEQGHRDLALHQEAADIIDEHLKNRADNEASETLSAKAILLAKFGKAADAESAIQRALTGGKGMQHFHHTTYNVACAYALMNKPDEAMKWLQFTADDGFPCYPLFEKDPYLDNLRKDDRFIVFMAKLKQQWERYGATL